LELNQLFSKKLLKKIKNNHVHDAHKQKKQKKDSFINAVNIELDKLFFGA
jgi:hypothetical protein